MTSREQAAIQPGNDAGQCALRRIGYTTGFGADRLPCILTAGHGGNHRDAFGRGFVNEDHGPSPVYRVMPDEADTITNGDNAVTLPDVPTADTIEPQGDAMPNARETAPAEVAVPRDAGWTEDDLREHFGDAVSLPGPAEDVPLPEPWKRSTTA